MISIQDNTSRTSAQEVDIPWKGYQGKQFAPLSDVVRTSARITKRSESSERLYTMATRTVTSSGHGSETMFPIHTPVKYSSQSVANSPRAASTSAAGEQVQQSVRNPKRTVVAPPQLPLRTQYSVENANGGEVGAEAAEENNQEYSPAFDPHTLLTVQMAKDIAAGCGIVRQKVQKAVHVGALVACSIALVSYFLTAETK